MPGNKKPRKKMKRKAGWAACVHHASLLCSPWVGEEWAEEEKQRVGFGVLEPVCALEHGDLRMQNWAATQNALEFGLLFCSRPDVLKEHASIKRELLGAYRAFLMAVDAHLGRREFLAGNVECARRALITVHDLLLAYRPREVNEHNELLRRRGWGQRWREKCLKEAFPDIDLSRIRFHEPPPPEAPDTIRRSK